MSLTPQGVTQAARLPMVVVCLCQAFEAGVPNAQALVTSYVAVRIWEGLQSLYTR